MSAPEYCLNLICTPTRHSVHPNKDGDAVKIVIYLPQLRFCNREARPKQEFRHLCYKALVIPGPVISQHVLGCLGLPNDHKVAGPCVEPVDRARLKHPPGRGTTRVETGPWNGACEYATDAYCAELMAQVGLTFRCVVSCLCGLEALMHTVAPCDLQDFKGRRSARKFLPAQVDQLK
jgi:hypothetical protein